MKIKHDRVWVITLNDATRNPSTYTSDTLCEGCKLDARLTLEKISFSILIYESLTVFTITSSIQINFTRRVWYHSINRTLLIKLFGEIFVDSLLGPLYFYFSSFRCLVAARFIFYAFCRVALLEQLLSVVKLAVATTTSWLLCSLSI